MSFDPAVAAEITKYIIIIICFAIGLYYGLKKKKKKESYPFGTKKQWLITLIIFIVIVGFVLLLTWKYG